ncbi:MAG: protein kinase domain-containing protein [Mycobacterium sp.]
MDEVRFGRYRLVALLGRGGMGEVWRAYDTATNRTVAIKLLPPHLASDSTYVQRFRREANAAAQLNNPHTIPIHNYGEIDGRLYVDMRLVEGRDLQAMLADGPLEPGRAVRIIEQAAKALQAAHKIGLVHRDVKSSNILLDEDDFAYLIDFGIARGADETSLTGTGQMIGSWHYMAPERLQAHEADARADIYALACVLYECLTGHRPFPGDSLESQVAAHLTYPPPRPSTTQPDVPAQFDAVIAKGMAKNPENRYPTTVELADAARDAMTLPSRTADTAPTAVDPTQPPSGSEPVWQQPARVNLAPTQQRPADQTSGPQPRPVDRPPREIGTPPPQQPTPVTSRNQLLVLGVAALVVVAALGGAGIYYFGTKNSNNTAAISTTTTTPIPTSNTTTPTPTGTTTTTSPSAAAAVPELAPFVGSWMAHVGILVIRQTGSGHLAYTDLRACPSCSFADAPVSTVDFTLTSVSNDVATGSVEASSDEQNVTVGADVTARLVAGSPSGQIVQISMGRMQQLNFCDKTSDAANQCGA